MIKTVNTNEKIPNIFYIFCNFNNPICNHNIKFTKQIISGAFCNFETTPNFTDNYLNGTQNYLPFIKSNKAPLSPSFYCHGMTNDYSLEYNLELYRYNNHSKYPSRLSAVYAFGDFNDCKKVSKLYGWDIKSVKKFKLKEDVTDKLIRISKHNMEIISYMRGLDCRLFSIQDQDLIYNKYWNGCGNINMEKIINNKPIKLNTGEIYEYLIEGILELIE